MLRTIKIITIGLLLFILINPVHANPFAKKNNFFKPVLRSSGTAPHWLIKQQALLREKSLV
jgi:hypothetical protein